MSSAVAEVNSPSSSAAPASPPTDHSHAVVTAHEPRARDLFPARITSLQPLSPTVLQLLLSIPESHRASAAFHPGQWVDFHIPSVSTIGGYSICSTPRTLATQGTMELAVKRSTHPPAAWVHAEAAVGTEVQMRVGGRFVYETEEQQRQAMQSPAATLAPAAPSSSADAPPMPEVSSTHSTHTHAHTHTLDASMRRTAFEPFSHSWFFLLSASVFLFADRCSSGCAAVAVRFRPCYSRFRLCSVLSMPPRCFWLAAWASLRSSA